MFRKSIIIIIMLTFIFPVSNILANEEIFSINAKSGILIDAENGEVFYAKKPNEELSPASMTKIMTMLIVMESLERGDISLKDEVEVTEKAWNMGGSQVFLGPGEIQIVENLLKSIAIASGNDASVAIAEHISGSEEAFVEKMNKRSKELNLKNTQFKNTHGLHEDDHYSSAYDIAIISKELVKHKKIFDYTTIQLDYLYHNDRERDPSMLANTNKMLRWYSDIDGLKTGSHSKALYCFSGTAKRDNLRLISVIFGAPSSNIRFSETAKMLDYGFANYQSVKVIEKNEVLKEITVEKGMEESIKLLPEKDFNLTVKKGENYELETKILTPERVTAPINIDQVLGKIIIYKNGKKVEQVSLIAEKDIEKINYIGILRRILTNFTRII